MHLFQLWIQCCVDANKCQALAKQTYQIKLSHDFLVEKFKFIYQNYTHLAFPKNSLTFVIVGVEKCVMLEADSDWVFSEKTSESKKNPHISIRNKNKISNSNKC